jgi:hypothetical protein
MAHVLNAAVGACGTRPPTGSISGGVNRPCTPAVVCHTRWPPVPACSLRGEASRMRAPSGAHACARHVQSQLSWGKAGDGAKRYTTWASQGTIPRSFRTACARARGERHGVIFAQCPQHAQAAMASAPGWNSGALCRPVMSLGASVERLERACLTGSGGSEYDTPRRVPGGEHGEVPWSELGQHGEYWLHQTPRTPRVVGGCLILGLVCLWLATGVYTIGPRSTRGRPTLGQGGGPHRARAPLAVAVPDWHIDVVHVAAVRRAAVGFRRAPQVRVRRVPRSHPSSACRRWKP